MIINFIVPGDINLPTGGYRYDKRILEEWKKAGARANLVSLAGDFPFPDNPTENAAITKIETLPPADVTVVDGLAGGAMPEFMKYLGGNSPTIALIHHPLCLENGLDETQSSQLKKTEKYGLEHVRGVVTTSPATAKTVHSLFDFEPSRIETILPGVERRKLAQAFKNGPLRFLCIGSLIERKGHRYLIEALAGLSEFEWTLDCFGIMDQQSGLYSDLMSLITEHELGKRITFHGGVSDDRIEEAYQHSHVFVLPSLFEGYGMAYSEAIVRGLPIIGTTAGAIPDTVPESCGILVEPENVDALRSALKIMLTDPAQLEQFRLGALASEKDFPTWESSAKKFLNILERWT